jgi:3-deoxy-D-manno-octulosonic acid (KDO) 8-phosphate synthase
MSITSPKNFEDSGCENFMFTERGTTFGYNNLVADMRSLYWMRELGHRVVFDATHSVQRPGGLGSTTGRRRKAGTCACPRRGRCGL